MPIAEIQFDAAALAAVETSTAPVKRLDGTTVDAIVRAFDDTTEEYASGKFQVPQDVDVGGTVTFRAAVLPATAASGKNAAHQFSHRAVAHSDVLDGSYTDEDSGDKACEAAAGAVSIHAWTETVANLGWSPGDLVVFRYSRRPAAADNLPGDLYLLHLNIEIPVE
ncbi:MAG: hypothetical protein JW809_17080 [Pirellulales bacterium]|nr:hypothetical protein [Pirellulales bacterium]